jgi:hypothetical protein
MLKGAFLLFLKRLLIAFSIMILLMSAALSQESEDPDTTLDHFIRLDLAYIIGGQLYNDNFLYNPGFNIYGTYGLDIHKRMSVGLGTGLQQFRNEKFIPVFIDITGRISKKNNTRLISLQGGYSFAWSESLKNLTDSKLNGGIYIGAGFGRKFYLNKAFSIIASISYRHQFAEIEYEVFNLKNYRERINYDLLVISISFLL